MSASVSVILVIFALLCIDQNEGLILYRDRYRDRYGKIRGRKSLLVNLKLKRFRICFVFLGADETARSVAGFCVIMMLGLATSAMALTPTTPKRVTTPSPASCELNRRALLSNFAAATGIFMPAAHAQAAEEGSFGGFAAQMRAEQEAALQERRAKQTPGDVAKEAYAQKVQDPFSGVRADDPGRPNRFADEIAPMSAEERRKRAAAAKELSENTRAKPQVSKNEFRSAGSKASATDEFTLTFGAESPLGLKLKDLRVGFELGTTEGTSRVLVSDVTPGGQADQLGKVSIDDIVVAVDGVNVERESAKQITQRLAAARGAGRPVDVTFKDALAFNAKLSDAKSGGSVATTIAPATEDGGEAQVLAVNRLSVPPDCKRNAQPGDLLEIRYTGRLADGTVFDGMELADRFMDDTIQFVLGRQPAGQVNTARTTAASAAASAAATVLMASRLASGRATTTHSPLHILPLTARCTLTDSSPLLVCQPLYCIVASARIVRTVRFVIM